MNIATDTVNDTRKTIRVSFTQDDIATHEKSLIAEFTNMAKLPGFRPGKAPEKMVRQRYAKQIKEELQRKVISEAYDKGLKDSDLPIYGLVNIEGGDDIKPGTEAEIQFTVDLRPEFDLPDYKEIEVESKTDEPSDEDIEKAIDEIRNQRADYKTVERAVEKGDFVKVSYEGKIGDQPVEEILPNRPMYSKQPVTWEEAGAEEVPGIQAIIQGIVGMSIDEEKEVEETFADDFAEEPLQGKTVTYSVKVLEVREKVLPEIDETFLKSLEVENEEEFRKRISDDIRQQKEYANRSAIRRQLMDKLSEAVDFPLPESAVEQETMQAVREAMQMQMQQGANPEDMEKNHEQLMEGAKKAAENRVKAEMLLQAIAEKEKIEVANEDLQQRIMQEAMMSRTKPDDIVKELTKDRAKLSQLRQSVLFNKTLDFLADSAKVTTSSEG